MARQGVFLIAFISVILASCGGGGGGGSDSDRNITLAQNEVYDDGVTYTASEMLVHTPAIPGTVDSTNSNFYYFDGIAGERYLVTLIVKSGDPDIGLFNSNILTESSLLLFSFATTSKQEIEFKATLTQRYFIEVASLYDISNYELRVERSPRRLSNGVNYPTNNLPAYEVITGDLNDDSLDDVVVMTAPNTYTGQQIIIYHQTQSGVLESSFVIDKSELQTVVNFKGIHIGDFNSDGLNDLAVLSENSTYNVSVLVYLQDVNSNLKPPVEYGLGIENYVGSDISVGDINNDNRDDVLVLSGPSLLILEQNQIGTLNSYYSNSLVVADYDNQNIIKILDLGNDNDADLAFRTGGLSFATLTQEPPGGLTFSNLYTITTDYWPNFNAFDTGDVNNDGLDDLVAIDPTGSGSFLNMFLQDASGYLFKTTFPQPFTIEPCGLKVDDVTGDGISDLIGDNIISGIIEVVRFIPGLGYSESDTYSAFPSTTIGGCRYAKIFSLADLNNDGFLDVVVGDPDFNPSRGIFVLLSTENTQKGQTLLEL